MEKISQKICKAYGFILRLCFFCAVVGLLLLSLVCICYMETSEYVYLCADAATQQTLLLAISFLAATGMGLAARKGRFQCRSLPALRLSLLALAGILGVLWVLNTRYIPRADQLSILEFAEHLRKKEYGVFGAGTYMARYPHQSGMVLLLCGLSYLWGGGNYVAFQLLNVGAYLVILWALGELSRWLGRGTVVPTLLDYLMKNPKYTAQMLLKKTASQWCDPLFEGHWILQQMKSDYDIPEQLQAVSAPVGSWHMSRLLNYLHIWILFGAAPLIFSGKEELSPEMLLLMTVFVGGFVFHTFWEAKGQYTLPYFVLLIPLAVQGYWSVLTAAKTGEKTWRTAMGPCWRWCWRWIWR